MSNITIWYRRQNESKYHKITQWINRNNQDPLISWNRDINDKFFQFTLKLYNPFDEDSLPFIPDTGDEFVVTDWQNNIFGNIFIGIAEDIKRTYYGLDDTEQATNKYFDILVQNKDFSTEKGITEKLNSSYINDLLPSLFNNTPSLGGVLSNGINIPKHDYGGENFLIPPLKLVGSQYERLLKLLDLIGWSFIYFYYSELSDTNGLHIVKQLNMFPKNSGRSASSDWQPGITFQSFTTGILATDDTENIICERNITYKKSNRQLKNSIELKLNLKSSISDVGKKFRQEVTEEKNIFLLGGAFDVKSIAIEIITFISSVISDSVFTISAEKASAINYYQERMNNNSLDGLMECDINSGSVDYNRVFTLDVLTNTITLAEPITGLMNGSKFTLTGAYNLLEPNLNSYPSDGNGYVIKNVDSENTSIKFTDYDMPNIGSFITGYYYPIETIYKTKNDTDSIDKLGFRGLEEEIKEPITNEQGEELFAEKRKKMKALEVLNLEASHRKNVLNLYTSIPVDLEDIKKVFIVTASEGKVIHDEGFYTNTPLITQQIELSTDKDNYGDLLSKIQNNSKATMNLNLKNNVEEIIRASIFIREKSNNSLPSLILPIMLDPSNILFDRFTVNFITSNCTRHRILFADNIDFIDSYNITIDIFQDPETTASFELEILDLNYPVFVKIQAVRGVELSPFSNIKQASNLRNYVIDVNTKVNNTFQNTLNNSIANNNHFVAINLAHIINTGYITDDNYSLDIASATNDYAQIANNAIFNVNEFTYTITFRFKTINVENTIINRFDTEIIHTDAQFYIAYNTTNGLYFGLYDSGYSNASGLASKIAFYNTFISLVANTEYTLQFAYKENTRNFNMCLNGVECGITFSAGDFNLSNITLKTSLTSRVLVGAAFGLGGQASDSNMIVSRFDFSNKYRTVPEALINYNIISA